MRAHVAERADPHLGAGHVAVRRVLPGEADAAVVLHVRLRVLERRVRRDRARGVGVEGRVGRALDGGKFGLETFNHR